MPLTDYGSSESFNVATYEELQEIDQLIDTMPRHWVDGLIAWARGDIGYRRYDYPSAARWIIETIRVSSLLVEI